MTQIFDFQWLLLMFIHVSCPIQFSSSMETCKFLRTNDKNVDFFLIFLFHYMEFKARSVSTPGLDTVEKRAVRTSTMTNFEGKKEAILVLPSGILRGRNCSRQKYGREIIRVHWYGSLIFAFQNFCLLPFLPPQTFGRQK